MPPAVCLTDPGLVSFVQGSQGLARGGIKFGLGPGLPSIRLWHCKGEKYPVSHFVVDAQQQVITHAVNVCKFVFSLDAGGLALGWRTITDPSKGTTLYRIVNHWARSPVPVDNRVVERISTLERQVRQLLSPY